MNSRFIKILIFSVACLFTTSAVAQPDPIVDPKSIKQFEKAKEAYQKRDNAGAMKLLKTIIERSDNYPDAHMLKFQIHQEANEWDLAQSELETVVKISPNFFPNAHLFLGRIALSEGEYKKALSSFERFEKYPDISPKLLGEARTGITNCKFAIEAKKSPVPFEPKSMGSAINSPKSEYFPTLTANDKTFLFTRRVDARNGSHEQEDFYISHKENDVWLEAQPMKFINTPMNEGAPSIAPDGELIIFTSCENNYGEYGGNRRGYGSCDLFYSFREGDRWSVPKNMGKNINSPNWETQPSISSDGRTIYFIRAAKQNRGIKDPNIYSSTLNEEGRWSVAEKLSDVINTPRDESSVLIHPDGRTLYFTSDGHVGMGKEDVFLSRKDDNGNWSKPMNLGYPINTHENENSLVVSAAGDIAYFASDREGGAGGMDLYQFDLYEDARPVVVSFMQGKVFDKDSKQPIQARFELIDVATEKVVVESYANETDGQFLVSLPTDKEYALNVSYPGYLFFSEHFSFTEGTKSEPYLLDVPLCKIKSGETLILENIFFDTDKYELKEKSAAEIKKLFDFLSNNSTLNVEILGHTDNVGSESHNQSLSENRAESVRKKLLEMGIGEDRIQSKGMGSTRPIESNDTEEGRAANRRTELRLL